MIKEQIFSKKLRFFTIISSFVVFLGGQIALAADDKAFSSQEILTWLPNQPRHGDVLHLIVKAGPRFVLKKAEMKSKPLTFFSMPNQSGQWHAFYGIDPKDATGDYEVIIVLASTLDSKEKTITASIPVLAKEFPEEHLTLPPSKVQLSPEKLERVRKEAREIASLWPEVNADRLWKGPFVLPVEGRPGSTFGLKRVINGEPRNFHTGMDVKVPEGMPIKAANSGRVALAGDHFFGGRSVFIDHGQGLYTMYFHLSQIKVSQGQQVSKGEVIGLAGMTGRASGPHLHWGVRLGGARVDPMALLEITKHMQQ